MKKEDLLNIKPESLKSDACKIFGSDPKLKKEYEKKWDTTVDCSDQRN